MDPARRRDGAAAHRRSAQPDQPALRLPLPHPLPASPSRSAPSARRAAADLGDGHEARLPHGACRAAATARRRGSRHERRPWRPPAPPRRWCGCATSPCASCPATRTVHAVNGVDLDLARRRGALHPGRERLRQVGHAARPDAPAAAHRPRSRARSRSPAATCRRWTSGALQDFRGGDVAMIFQEPMTALDPVFTIGQQIAETVRRHEKASPPRRRGAGAGAARAGADPLRQAPPRRLSARALRRACASAP